MVAGPDVDASSLAGLNPIPEQAVIGVQIAQCERTRDVVTQYFQHYFWRARLTDSSEKLFGLPSFRSEARQRGEQSRG